MNLTIPDEWLEKNHLSSQKIKQEFSLFLLEKHHLPLEQVLQIAEMSETELRKLAEKNKTFKKLSHLKNRNCVIGDSENLIHLDWSDEWKTPLI
jgi:hypothetical protein